MESIHKTNLDWILYVLSPLGSSSLVAMGSLMAKPSPSHTPKYIGEKAGSSATHTELFKDGAKVGASKNIFR